jgi:hypothetical protein
MYFQLPTDSYIKKKKLFIHYEDGGEEWMKLLPIFRRAVD